MGEKIFIARQDTLEEVLAAVKSSSEGEVLPALWIAEYKLHGEKSYVFRDADIWARMCKSTAAANDTQINGEALKFVLTHPGAASLSDWLMRLSDTRVDGQALFAGIETVDELAENADALTALLNSETIMPALFSNEMIMTAFGTSATAMNVVCSDEKVLEKAMQSPHYGKTMNEKDMPAAKLAAALAGITFETVTGFAGIVSDTEAMQAVALSGEAMAVAAFCPAAMNRIAANAEARGIVFASEHYGETMGANDMAVAKILAALAGLEVNMVSGMADITENADRMGLFATSKNLLGAVAENLVAITAIEGSEAAISILGKSPLLRTAAYPITNEWKTHRTGRVFLLGQTQNVYGGGASLGVGYTIVGHKTVSSRIEDTYRKYAAINRFMDGICNYFGSTSALTVTYKFIPIDEEAET